MCVPSPSMDGDTPRCEQPAGGARPARPSRPKIACGFGNRYLHVDHSERPSGMSRQDLSRFNPYLNRMTLSLWGIRLGFRLSPIPVPVSFESPSIRSANRCARAFWLRDECRIQKRVVCAERFKRKAAKRVKLT